MSAGYASGAESDMTCIYGAAEQAPEIEDRVRPANSISAAARRSTVPRGFTVVFLCAVEPPIKANSVNCIRGGGEHEISQCAMGEQMLSTT